MKKSVVGGINEQMSEKEEILAIYRVDKLKYIVVVRELFLEQELYNIYKFEKTENVTKNNNYEVIELSCALGFDFNTAIDHFKNVILEGVEL